MRKAVGSRSGACVRGVVLRLATAVMVSTMRLKVDRDYYVCRHWPSVALAARNSVAIRLPAFCQMVSHPKARA